MQFRKWLAPQYLLHYLLWMFFLLSLVADVYTQYNRDPLRFYIYVFSKTAVIIALVYTSLLVLHPLLFGRKKYILYGLSVLLLCAVVGITNTFLERYMSPSLRGRELSVFFGQFTMALRYFFIAVLLQIMIDYYKQKEILRKIEVEKANAELNFLRAQVNPHFLFNTLNNLYGLILQRSDHSAEAVLKLADIMKYILAEGKEDKVPLEKEIRLIQNYTELERLRKADAAIDFIITGNVNGQQITPLLLLPLIENAFKYGMNTVSRNGFIHITLQAGHNDILFEVKNNNPPASNKEALHSMGIGIENLKQRLKLLYPGKYEMQIREDPDFFNVTLQLQLK